MRLLHLFLAAAVLTVTATGVEAAKKKKTDTAVPEGYSKVTFVDLDKKTFNVSGDDNKYTFTDKTGNYEKITVGAVLKLTTKDGSKTDVTSVDVAPETPAKKKKKNNNN